LPSQARFIYHQQGMHVNLTGRIAVLYVLEILPLNLAGTPGYAARYLHLVYLPAIIMPEDENDDDSPKRDKSPKK